MLNRLISLVVLLLILNIDYAYSETNFLLPQKKPSIFKKTEKKIQEMTNLDLPVPKPRSEQIEPEKPLKIEKKNENIKIKETKKKKEEVEIISKSFVFPKKNLLPIKLQQKKLKHQKFSTKKIFKKLKKPSNLSNKKNGIVH